MRVLLIHTKYQLHGGEDTVVEQELELLRQHHIVEVLYFHNQKGVKGAIQFFGSIWNFFAAKKVKQKIQEFKPDVIHIHNWHFATGPLIFRVINRIGVPIVHTIHNYRLICPSAILLHDGKLFTDSLYQSFPWKAVQNKAYRSSFVQTFWLAFLVWTHKKIGTWKKIDTYVCLTAFAVNVFQQSNFGIFEKKFKVKPNFINASGLLVSGEREQYYLFVGRLSVEKGIDVLLNAFKELPFQLKIAGDGPLKKDVIDATSKFSNISYLGSLSSTEIDETLVKAQALILPSVCYEGMPMTILEAFSTSTPVITSNLGAMTSMISNNTNGFLFEAGSISNLKKTICKYEALSSSVKKQIGLNALESYKSTYSPQLQKEYFDDIYYSIVKKNIQ